MLVEYQRGVKAVVASSEYQPRSRTAAAIASPASTQPTPDQRLSRRQ